MLAHMFGTVLVWVRVLLGLPNAFLDLYTTTGKQK